jgi:hypothetical protein
MTDIICISPEVFTQAKSIIQVEKKIEELYAHLVSSHTCFSMIPVHYDVPHTRSPRHHKQHHSKHVTDSRKPTITTNDPLRKVKGLLNVVNTTNFDKINRKIQFIINEKNVHDICTMVIHTACIQVFFVHIFMRLLNHSVQTSPKILETCATFVDDFFSNDELFNIPESETQDFADYQKKKKLAINTAVVVMEMIKNQHTKQYKVQHFVSYLLNRLETPKSNIEFDLLLSVLVEIKKRSTNVKLDKSKLLSIKSNSTETNITDTRIQFMLETLLK